MKKNLCKCPMLLTAVALMVAVSAGFWSAAFAAPAFSQIDFVRRTGTEPHGITEDGSVIAGVFDPVGEQSQGFLDIEAFGFLLFGCSDNSEIYGICGVSGSFSIVGIILLPWFCLEQHRGGCTDIKYPNAALTYVHGINKSGQIVGGWHDASSYPIVRGFLRESDGSFTSFEYPYPNGALSQTVGYGINDAGQIVGYYSDASGYHHGFLRNSNGNFSKIDAPGAGNTYAYGTNDAGKIVGSYTSKNDPFQVIHGFLYGPK